MSHLILKLIIYNPDSRGILPVNSYTYYLSDSNRTLTFPARKGYNNNNFVINENFVYLINKKEDDISN